MPRGKRINPAALYFPDKIQEKLSYLKDYPLTVIHAPAGFGKSTALRRFFEQKVSKSTPVLWHTFLARAAPPPLALHLRPDRPDRPKMRRRVGRHRPAQQRRATRVGGGAGKSGVQRGDLSGAGQL